MSFQHLVLKAKQAWIVAPVHVVSFQHMNPKAKLGILTHRIDSSILFTTTNTKVFTPVSWKMNRCVSSCKLRQRSTILARQYLAFPTLFQESSGVSIHESSDKVQQQSHVNTQTPCQESSGVSIHESSYKYPRHLQVISKHFHTRSQNWSFMSVQPEIDVHVSPH